jgi:hypothetical protein
LKDEKKIDKGKLWFLEDDRTFKERQSNGKFIFCTQLFLFFVSLVLLSYFTIIASETDIISILFMVYFFFVMILIVIFTGLMTFRDKPIKFYENGVEITRMGRPLFKPYGDLKKVKETWSPVWGKIYVLPHKNIFQTGAMIRKNNPNVKKYISRIREKIEGGKGGRNRSIG